MLVLVHYRREFLTGNLAGLTAYESFRSDLNMAPRIGSVVTRKVWGTSGTARDTILGVEPYETVQLAHEPMWAPMNAPAMKDVTPC